MKKPSRPVNETARLDALKSLGLLDTQPEASYDLITSLVQRLFKVPIAAISLVGRERQWFKSIQGLDISETSREVSFCGHTILQDGLFVIDDTLEDPRFYDNPLVINAPHIRFYAGCPLHSHDNFRIGSLCIIDTKPRKFTTEELVSLKEFASLIEQEIFVQRKANGHLSQIAKIQEMYISGHTKKEELFNTILHFLLIHTNSEFGLVGAIQSDQERKYLKIHAKGSSRVDKKMRTTLTAAELKGLQELAYYTIRTGEILITNDPYHDPRTKNSLSDKSCNINNYLAVPIYSRDGLIAMFAMANRHSGYTYAQVNELKAMTNTIAAIVESIQQISIIDEMANKDALTRTYNRYYFHSHLKELVTSSSRQNQPGKFCLLMIDFNGFKKINDYYGHPTGDQLLIDFIKRVRPNLKKRDFIARIGGDEFMVVLNNIQEYSDAAKVAERLTALSNEPYDIQGKKITCPISIGLACYPDPSNTFDKLMRHADFALYEAKKSMKQYQFYSEGFERSFNEKIKLEKDLLASFKNKDFFCVFQPQIDTKTNEIISYEMLLRWNHPEQKHLLPDAFIPAFEEMGMSEEVNLYIITMVINYLKTLPRLSSPLKIALNISPYVLNFDKHIQNILQLIKNSQLDPNIKLEFEITEASFMSSNLMDNQKLLDAFAALKEAGIDLAIDDFGIKYSSINRLLEYQFNTIKIDQLFVHKLDKKDSKATRNIIKVILKLAKQLKLSVIAEGVETKRQAEILRRLKCRYMQGFYFHKPLSFEEMLEQIKKG